MTTVTSNAPTPAFKYFNRAINAIGNMSTGMVPVAGMGAIGGRILGLPFAVGAFQGVATRLCTNVLDPVERLFRKQFGPGPDQINQKGVIVIESVLLATAIIAPTLITSYFAPTVLSTVGSYAPNFIASWIVVEKELELPLGRLALTTIAPFATEVILKIFREYDEENQRIAAAKASQNTRR